MTEAVAETMRDYSQNGEQDAILLWAPQQAGGAFVDLGCYDGETYSNTAALAELGWAGVCVDASPDAAAECARRYADRPDVEVVLGAIAVGDSGGGPVPIYWTAGRQYTSMTASLRRDVEPVAIHVARLDLGWLALRIAVLPRPRFCSIDLEGESVATLEWLVDNAEVDCVCVEANVPAERVRVRERLAGWVELAEFPSNLVLARVAA